MFLRILSVLGAASALFGCDDPLKRVDLIAEPRPVGARVEVEGAPERAAPYPGESASVRFWIAAPDPDPELGWTLSICVAAAARAGSPSCAEPAFASATRAEPVAGVPELAFVVPDSLDAEATPRLAVLGVICTGGEPRGEGAQARCQGGTQARVSLDFDLATDDDENRNPTFAADAIELDGEPWAASAVVTEPCEGLGLSEVSADGAEHALAIAIPDGARDPLPADEDTRERESLLLSHFVTLGEVERAFSSLSYDSSATSLEVPWFAPATAAEGGELARFWFVLRDQRGGADLAERSICVLP